MALSIKTRKAIITTLTKAEQDNPTPLDLGIRLKDCLHKRLVWEPYTGELTKDFIYCVCDNGTIERLPLKDFKDWDLNLTLGTLLKDCIHKRLGWEPYVRSQVKVYHPANAKVYHPLHGY